MYLLGFSTYVRTKIGSCYTELNCKMRPFVTLSDREWILAIEFCHLDLDMATRQTMGLSNSENSFLSLLVFFQPLSARFTIRKSLPSPDCPRLLAHPLPNILISNRTMPPQPQKQPTCSLAQFSWPSWQHCSELKSPSTDLKSRH